MSGQQPSRTDPVRQLIDEHEIFMDALEELKRLLSSVPSGAEELPAGMLAAVEEIWRAVNEHLNVHFVKEEEVFFPLIERLFPGARVKFQFLHIDHERLRENFEDFTEALQDYRVHMKSARSVATLRRVGEEMIRWFYYHIVAEDSFYFDIASRKMLEDETDEALQRMDEIESRLRERIASDPSDLPKERRVERK